MVVCVNARFFFPYFSVLEDKQAFTIYPVDVTNPGKLEFLILTELDIIYNYLFFYTHQHKNCGMDLDCFICIPGYFPISFMFADMFKK
jgi:hypothetical protein